MQRLVAHSKGLELDDNMRIELPPESQATETLLRLRGLAHGGDALLYEAADEMSALRKDAERYRWLAGTFSVMSPNIDGNHHWTWRGHSVLGTGASMAEAVDNGMARR